MSRWFVIGMGLLVACGGDASGPSGPPVILSINGALKPAATAGSTVVIEGSSFGSAQGSGAVLFSNGSGGTVTAVIQAASDWSNTLIITTVPAGAASGNVVVQTSQGTSAPLGFTLAQGSAFSPSTISWTATADLPAAVSGEALVYAQLNGTRVIWSLGGSGAGNAPVSTVHYSTLGAGVTLAGWTATTPLPAALAFHAAVAATQTNSRVASLGYLYVLGGSSDAAGTPSAVVYRGTLAADGTVSAWAQAGSLPVALHSLGAAIFHGDLYVVGGASNGNVPVTAVYRSRIGSAGELGAWQTQPALPFRRAHFGFGVYGDYLYAIGGDSGVVAPNSGVQSNSALSDVVYARITPQTGNLTAAGWSGTTHLNKERAKLSAALAGGSLLVTAGLYNGATSGASEESYAALNVDGSVGSFNGATGSNTIASLVGGANLFNHAAVTYQDGLGLLHVLVAGGDDVNAPGTKRRGVYVY